jgi:hypothetical protein
MLVSFLLLLLVGLLDAVLHAPAYPNCVERRLRAIHYDVEEKSFSHETLT